MVCALGDSLAPIVAALRRQEIRLSHVGFPLAGLPYTRPYYLIDRGPQDRLESRDEAYFYGILFSTVERAIADAGLSGTEIKDLHLFFGSTSMDIPVFEGRHRQASEALSGTFRRSAGGYGKIADSVLERFGIAGNAYTFITACTSSANALLYAAAMIEEGGIERALVVGYDLFNTLGFYGFEGLKSIAAAEYRPFDRERDGLILGEACGAAILSSRRRTGEDFSCLGGANLCDTAGVTSHDESGAAVAETMVRALARAGVGQGHILAIKAHATGTVNNDRSECAALRAVFGDAAPPVTGLKPYIGHTVGACGVNEMILFTEALKAGFIPATPGFRQPDEELGLKPLTACREAARGAYMLNYFGFGGNCTSLILSNRGDD